MSRIRTKCNGKSNELTELRRDEGLARRVPGLQHPQRNRGGRGRPRVAVTRCEFAPATATAGASAAALLTQQRDRRGAVRKCGLDALDGGVDAPDEERLGNAIVIF